MSEHPIEEQKAEETWVAPLASVEARYKDLLNRLGVLGHDGAVAEIRRLRIRAGLEDEHVSG